MRNNHEYSRLKQYRTNPSMTNKNLYAQRIYTQPTLQIQQKENISKGNKQNFNIQLKILPEKNQYNLLKPLQNLSIYEKKIALLKQKNQPNASICISSKQKQSIIKQFHSTRIKHQNKTQIMSVGPAQKMMLQFNRQLKRIKKSQIINKFDDIKQNKNKLQAFSTTISQSNVVENQGCVRFGEGIYVLCDGHGSNGKQVARFICYNIFEKCLIYKLSHKIKRNTLSQIFLLVQKQLQISSIDIAFSGSSCLVVVYTERQIFVANLGDSLVLLKRQTKIQSLSIQHVPCLQVERQRVQSVGGVIRQLQVSKGKFSGPLRIWAPGKNSWGPGLSLTRSFGHKAARRYGLISQPQIFSYQINFEQHILVIGTKGLFQTIKYESIINTIKKQSQQNRQQICTILAQQALKKSQGQFESISVIVILS